jgi:protein involved in polysaccharide export with SLBB domain
VAGLEPPDVAEAIATRLRDGQFLVAPHVAIVVREYNSKRISVLGAVRNPGTYAMRSGMGVVEAIGLAGGFTSLANRDATVITRRTGDDLRRISAPVDRITNGNDSDIPIRAGDIISVPERLF